MGNQNSEFQEKFKSNYGFIQLVYDQVYGMAKIYRKNFQNYHYVMVIDKSLQPFPKNGTTCLRPAQRSKFDKIHPNYMLKKQSQLNRPQKNQFFENQARGIQQKIKKLRNILDSIKRYQDNSIITLFSYIIVNQKLQCNQKFIRLYVQYQNHRLVQYLQVLRTKKMWLLISQVLYIIKVIINGLLLFQKIKLQLNDQDIGIRSIFTTTEGEVKLNPVYIINKKQQLNEHIQNILSMKQTHLQKIQKSQKFQLINSNSFDKQSLYSSSTAEKQNDSGKNQKVVYVKILNKLITDLSIYIDPRLIRQCQKMIFYLNRQNDLNSFFSILSKQWKKQSEGLQIYRIYQIEPDNNKSQQQNK